MKHLGLILITVVSTLFACDPYEFPKGPYARVETISVGDVTESGASFQGDIMQVGDTPIIQHGFIWGTVPSLSLPGDFERTEFGPATMKTRFDGSTNALESKTTYFVRAYIQTEDYATYGEVVQFQTK